MKFVDSKNIREYVSNECMLTSWGGLDDYTFQFVPEVPVKQVSLIIIVLRRDSIYFLIQIFSIYQQL